MKAQIIVLLNYLQIEELGHRMWLTLAATSHRFNKDRQSNEPLKVHDKLTRPMKESEKER
jgi:hypothetical protein